MLVTLVVFETIEKKKKKKTVVRYSLRCISLCLFWSTDTWEDRWISSTHKGAEQGKFKHSAGKFYGDAEKDKGEQMLLNAHIKQCYCNR